MVFSAIAGLAGSLLGANRQRQEAKDARMFNERQTDPAYIRQRYEAAGFHPILGLGGPVASAVTSNFGSIIANGFGSFGRAVQEDQALKLQATALEQENERLRRRNERMMLHPETGGIYGRNREAREAGPLHYPSRDNAGRDLAGGVSGGVRGGLRQDGVPVTSPRRLHVPAWRAFGTDYYPSGRFSDAQSFEDSGAEGLSWLLSPFAVGDTVGHTWGVPLRQRRWHSNIQRLRYGYGGLTDADMRRSHRRGLPLPHSSPASSKKSNASGSRGRGDRRDRSRSNLYR